jgi:lipoprotein LprG
MSWGRGGLAVGGVLLAGALAGCGGGSDESAPDLLERAKTVLDEADSAHFVLTSDGAPDSGAALLGGEGDLARPSSFEGTLQVQVTGAGALDLEVVSVDGTVYAQLPFTSSFSAVDPAQFGFGDPGAFLDPETGISQLLAEAESAELGEERRVDGEIVREVAAQLPGDLVADLLTSADPDQDVAASFSVATESGELRRAELTGPFFEAGSDATYTLELSDFGADVEITAPTPG